MDVMPPLNQRFEAQRDQQPTVMVSRCRRKSRTPPMRSCGAWTSEHTCSAAWMREGFRAQTAWARPSRMSEQDRMTSPLFAPMPDIQPCGPPPYPSVYRAAAVFLWLIPAFRAASPLDAVFACSLAGCLWWVAQRQTSPEAALLAAGFFATLSPAQPAAPLGIFAMLYTATGVAHALQGPRRKWSPRIALMTGATLFTVAVDPLACGAGLRLGALLSCNAVCCSGALYCGLP